MPASDVDITAHFILSVSGGVPFFHTNTLTATGGEGGRITPTGTTYFADWSTVTYTITPDPGYKIADVLVDGVSVGAVEFYTFNFIRASHTIEARFEPVHFCPGEQFTDVDTSSWYHEGVDFVLSRNLYYLPWTNTFASDANMTRAMLVMALWRLEGEPAPSAGNRFADVSFGSWYETAVVWADEAGIVKGYDATTFGPDDPLTNEQIAVILHRYADCKGYDLSATADLSVYTDLNMVSTWALTAMKWAVGNGLVKGVSPTQLDPAGYATRAQVATIIMRLVSGRD